MVETIKIIKTFEVVCAPVSIFTFVMATLTTRVATTLAYAFRLAVNRFGVTPVLLVALAGVAALLSLRRSASNNARRRRSRRQPPNTSSAAAISNVSNIHDSDLNATTNGTSEITTNSNARASTSHSQHLGARASRTPQWLTCARRVSIGAVCSFSQSCPMFILDRVANASDEKDELSDKTPPATKPKVVLALDAVSPLKSIASMSELYVVIRVDDDLVEHAVTDAFAAAGLFDRGLLDRRKLIFCETDIGRVSVARQLEPNIHIDESVQVISDLQRFLSMVALVSPDANHPLSDSLGRNVAKFPSLAALYSS